jgi:tetratricopeptide (TPR) repeat protein
LAVTCALATTAAAHAEDPSTQAVPGETSPRARELLGKGLDAIADRSFERARTLLLEAFELSRSYDVAAALGQSELALGRHRDAAEHLEFALRNFPPSESLSFKAKARRALASARERVAAARVVTEPQGAEVLVDGKVVGTTPLEAELFLDPGRHTIEARLPSGATESQTVEVAAGAQYDINLRPAKDGPRSAGEVRADSSSFPTKTVLVVGGAVATVALATFGAVELARGNKAAKDVTARRDAAREALGSNCPASSTAPECQALFEAIDRRNSANKLVPIGFGAAAVTGVATVLVYFLMPANKRTQTSALESVNVSLGPKGSFLSVRTTF